MWLIGLSGAGKTTLSRAVAERVRAQGQSVVVIDGDAIREVFGSDLGHSREDRRTNAARISRLCGFLSAEGIHVVCAILSAFEEHRVWNRKHVRDYFEVFIDTPMERLLERDGKQLYARALSGEIDNVVGVDIDFERPQQPDVVIRNDGDIDSLLREAATLADEILGARP